MFDLEKAIDIWRARLDRQAGISESDLTEMEEHLREETQALTDSGLSSREAFLKAVGDFGNEVELAKSFRQVNWEKSLFEWFYAQPALLGNYLKIAVRNLLKYKIYSAINILGLAIGMTCCALILLYVQHELSFDTFHSKGDRIYRLLRESKHENGANVMSSGVSGPIAPALKKDFPETEAVVRIASTVARYIKSGKRQFGHDLNGILAAEPNFLNIFDFKMISGDRESALQDPYSIILSEETARRYYGTDNPIGKIVTMTDGRFQGDYKVTGVVHVPENSSLQFDMMCSLHPSRNSESWVNFFLENWLPRNSYRPFCVFVVLRENADSKALETKLPDFVMRYMGKEMQEQNTYHLQPLRQLHLRSIQNLPGVSMIYGDIRNIYLFSAIAFLILVMACVNFMNLATARSANRAKEIGMRKVSGAQRSQLIWQFLGEAVLLSFLSFAFAFGLIEFTLPAFSDFVGKDLMIETNLYLVLAVSGIVIFVGLFSGIYPALFLSAFEPIVTLRGLSRSDLRGVLLRKGLVAFQFSLSILLIIGTMMVYRQLQFIQNKNLGFQKNHIINMKLFWFDVQKKRNEPNEWLSNRYNSVKGVFLKNPNVLGATAYRAPIGTLGGHELELHTGSGEAFQVMVQLADEDFLETLGINLVVGRSFHKSEMTGESNSIVLNESAARLFGWEDPIGEHLFAGSTQMTVVGLVEDFHYQSLYENIKPLIIRSNHNFWELSVKVSGTNLPETLAFLEESWKQFLPDRPFEFSFMDEQLDRLYREDKRVGKMVGTFTLLAIAVACLGLFGLAAFTAEQRTKEIGMRKILGASVSNIMVLLSTEFAKLVLIANLIAWPAAYFLVDGWLENFAYRVDLSWWVFAFASIVALLIAWGTVGYQAWRAALSNPIEALSYK